MRFVHIKPTVSCKRQSARFLFNFHFHGMRWVWVICTVVTSVILSAITRLLLDGYHYHYYGCLTLFQSFTSLVVLEIACCFEVIKRANLVPFSHRWVLGLSNVLSTVCTLYSFEKNSPAITNLFDFAIIPTISVLGALFGMKAQNLITIGILFIGCIMANTIRGDIDACGLIIGLIGVVTTAFNRVFSKHLLDSYEIKGSSLLHCIGVQQVIISLIISFTIDRDVINHFTEKKELRIIIFFCFVSFGMQFSIYKLTETMTPLSCQITLYSISIASLALSIFVLNVGYIMRKMIGFILSLIGLILYIFFENCKKESQLSQTDLNEDINAYKEGLTFENINEDI